MITEEKGRGVSKRVQEYWRGWEAAIPYRFCGVLADDRAALVRREAERVKRKNGKKRAKTKGNLISASPR
jgi:hypothetical protein